MSKTSAREQALNALYAADVTGAAPATEGLSGRARRYVEGTWSDVGELDRQIEEAATGWRLGRMPAVDRNVLRLALYELQSGTTPVGVVVSEAVNLAKRFSTERSGAFVNAVLSKLIDPQGR